MKHVALITDFVNKSNSTESGEVLLDELAECFRKLGFDQLELSLRSGSSQTRPTRINNYSGQWCEAIDRDVDRMLEPVRRQLTTAKFAYCWVDRDQRQKTVDTNDPHEPLNIDHGIAIPFSAFPSNSAYLIASSSNHSVSATQKIVSYSFLIAIQFYHRHLQLDTEIHQHSPPELTEKERIILGLTAQGLSKKEISAHLNLSPHTIDFHFRNIFSKLQTKKAVVAVVRALSDGIITL